MELCKCGKDASTTHACDAPAPILLNGEPAMLGFVSPRHHADMLAALQSENKRLRDVCADVARMACPGRGYKMADIRRRALEGAGQ